MSVRPASRTTQPPEALPARTLIKRLKRVEGLVEPAALRPEEDIEHVHKLRVATRRSQAALDVFRAEVPKKLRKKTRDLLKQVRRAAGDARDADVHRLAFEAMPDPDSADERAALRHVLARIAEDRETAQAALLRVHEAGAAEAIREKRRSLEERGLEDPSAPIEETARDSVRAALASLEDAARDDLTDLENLHTVRKRAKNLRYTLEMLADALPGDAASLVGELRTMQDVLGALNDQASIVERLGRYLGDLERGKRDDDAAERGLRALLARARADLDEVASSAAETWTGDEAGRLLGSLRRLTAGPDDAGARPADPAPAAALRVRPGADPGRLAAIDVGTNSIRLIIAELDGDGSYRVLDDEKEITRLGAGLAETGRMAPGAIERSVQAIARMREIADGFGCGAVRAVGTAVAREAENASELRDAVLRRTGVEIEIISPEREAQLAFRSVASAFNIKDQAVAIMDIGGGSTEVVLSSRGLIETVYAIPMGAVRVTERFGGADAACGPRFDEMRRYVRGEIKRIVGKPPFTPQRVIGTGGTLTTLANMLVHQQRGALWAESGDAVVRGLEIQRSDLRHTLDRLQKMTLAERARVPGLPGERADIIVAGLVIAECMMKRLAVNEMRVHDRGIRDGLLLEMAEQARGGGPADPPADPMRSVHRFAAACRYDHAHCEHVAGLALQIFDQLRARAKRDEPAPEWAAALTDEARLILEAAALLQDAGYHVNYARHHKHSHHLILHADLPGFTPRQTRMIANTARYHRRAAPKLKHESYARLAAADRATVRALAAILRVAGGLDRAHVRRVSAVRVELDGEDARFAVDAPEDPRVELWGAARKAELFENVFNAETSFVWAPASPGAPPPTGTAP